MYADDTALIFSESDKEILLKRVIDNINTLTEYFNAYDLTLNIQKTQTLLFANRSNDKISIPYKGHNLTSKDEVVLLGLHIDKKLDWKCHIDFLAKNIASYCYAMKVIPLFIY